MCLYLQCLPADTLAIYKMSEQSRLDGPGLQELCPTMLQQLDSGTCRAQKEEETSADPPTRPSDAEGERGLVTDQECKMLDIVAYFKYHAVQSKVCVFKG